MSVAAYRAHVLYEYQARDDDQLSIRPGDILNIIDASAELNGWALAQKGDKEGYVPAEYVQSIDDNSTTQPYDWNNGGDEWQPSGFKTYYETVLSQQHNLPFRLKFSKAVKEVLMPCPCRQLDYVMARPESRRGAILTLLFGFVICSFDGFSILSPILPIGNADTGGNTGGITVCVLNVAVRAALTLLCMKRYPRPNLDFTTFPLINIISSLTFSIRIYESLELGDNKEYDGYRYYRSWMWSSFTNLPFAVVALVLVLTEKRGSIALAVLVLVGNLLNVGRCFLASWARKESGNDIHPDFESTIKRYRL
jgi:hypothetical protein